MELPEQLHKSVHIHIDAADAHLALDSPDGFKRNAHSDQDGAGSKGDIRHAGPLHQKRGDSGQNSQEDSRKQVQAVHDVLQILPDVLAPLSGDHSTLLLQLFSLLLGIKADGRIEEGESNDEQGRQDQINIADSVAIAESGEHVDGEITWASSDTTKATVSGGVVTGVAAGSAVITATCGDAVAVCNVTVTN